VGDWLLCTGTEQDSRLIVALVVDLVAVRDHLSQLVVHQSRVPGLLYLPTELELTDSSYNSHVQEHEVWIVDEVGRVEVPTCDVDDAYSC